MTSPALRRLLRRDVYKSTWFSGRQRLTRQSAEAILPHVLELVSPTSIVDIGCGLGTWLAVAREHGVERVLGVDGDYVDRQALEIPGECFVSWDLRRRLRLDETFDLALSLEVAEHLPPENARTLVGDLAELAPVVFFSAAVPFQGGTGHLNEQWPDYWASLFSELDYVAVDCVRRLFWRDERVRYFYAQNALLYVDRARLADYPELLHEAEDDGSGPPLPLVHPRLYSSALKRFPQAHDASFEGLARFLVRLAASPFRRFLGRSGQMRSRKDA